VRWPHRSVQSRCGIQYFGVYFQYSLVRSLSRLVLRCLAMKMPGSVTARAECNEILFGVIPQSATRAEVVDLKILCCAAVLAAPPIAREHLTGELAVRLGLKPQPLSFEPVQGRFSQCPATAVFSAREERR